MLKSHIRGTFLTLILFSWYVSQISADDVVTLTVRVPAVDLQGRDGDEGPAEFAISSANIPPDRRIDLSSFEVRRWDATGQKPAGEALPSRWYDALFPDEFPIVDGNASGTDGKYFHWEMRRRWAEFFPVIGDGKAGKIAWLHRQTKMRAVDYQISYRLLPAGQTPTLMPRRGFIGDGSPRCEPLGASTTGMVHGRLAVADWNQDGLVDLLVGGSIGNIIWYPNQGTKTEPKFSIAHLILQGDGKPFDVGWGAVPLVVDWDGDGWRDLLFGTHQGHVWLHAAQEEPGQYDPVGVQLMLSSGEPVHVGPQPGQDLKDFTILQGSRTTFTATDFDDDGLIDLVVGDTEGVARYFRNVGTTTKPIFEMSYEFETLGLRMVPFAADWDHDRRMDVVGSAANGKVVVWINHGDGKFATGVPIAFPPAPYSPSVSVVDWNEDGDDDLIIGTAYGFFCWIERSFLERGAMQAELAK